VVPFVFLIQDGTNLFLIQNAINLFSIQRRYIQRKPFPFCFCSPSNWFITHPAFICTHYVVFIMHRCWKVVMMVIAIVFWFMALSFVRDVLNPEFLYAKLDGNSAQGARDHSRSWETCQSSERHISCAQDATNRDLGHLLHLRLMITSSNLLLFWTPSEACLTRSARLLLACRSASGNQETRQSQPTSFLYFSFRVITKRIPPLLLSPSRR
jgi:hypothetical protein